MATTTAPTRRTRFSRRIPDHVTDELVNVLSIPRIYEFNALFGLVYENLKKRNAVSGGEEMLRLRAYEKLQNLVSRGLVRKDGKTYLGLEGVKTAIVPIPPRPAVAPSPIARVVETPRVEPVAKPAVAVVKTPVTRTAARVTTAKPVRAVAPVRKAAASAAKPRTRTTTKAASAKAPVRSRVATGRR